MEFFDFEQKSTFSCGKKMLLGWVALKELIPKFFSWQNWEIGDNVDQIDILTIFDDIIYFMHNYEILTFVDFGSV